MHGARLLLMHSAEDSAAIAIRILQRRERERPVEAAERRHTRARSLGEPAHDREKNDRFQATLAESRNEVASLREYTAALEARLNGLYAEMAQPVVPLRPRGIMRRLVRATVFALLGALAADVSQGIRRQFQSPTSNAP